MTEYPALIDNTTTLPTVVDNATSLNGAVVNRLRDAILAIENELGMKPSSIYGTVRARLDKFEQTLFDQAGAGPLTIVGSPQQGQVPVWSGTSWIPSTNFYAQSIQTTGGITAGPIQSTQETTGLIILGGKLIMNGITTSLPSQAGQGIIYYDSASNQFLVSSNGGSYAPLVGGASNVAYTPASSANWNNSPPATVAAALDRIAAKIGPIS